ncbi:MAG: zinc ribbon domain-containing protein [Lachnospiraceae bacterium]|nr:zinc ribbon domain-containing protein [Lachnospiraceae bacterium]
MSTNKESKEPSQRLCQNCGAEIKKSDTKCPYCGYINEEGAEKKYMDRLYDIRNDLDTVDDEAAAGYGTSFKKPLKIVAVTLIVLIIITGIGFGISGAIERREFNSSPQKSDDMLKEMTWKKEAFAEFDRLYEAGEYEKLCAAVFDPSPENYPASDWKHYWFAEIYNDYLMTQSDLERIDKEGWNKYDASIIFNRCCFCYYEDLYKNAYSNSLTDDEIKELEPALTFMNNVLHERLGFTDEDMAELKGTLIGKYNYLNYDECSRIAKERMSQFK